MRILTLIIKKRYLDEIVEGRKMQEYREVKPTTYRRYCELDAEGNVLFDDKKGIFVPRRYDAIRFYAGYASDRASALVEVKGAEIELFVDENGEFITYEHEGQECLLSQVVYNLGRVLEVG